MTRPSFQRAALRALVGVAVLLLLHRADGSDDPFQPVTQDETVAVGGRVVLTCSVMESENSSLQWSNTAQQTLFFGEKKALKDTRIKIEKFSATELTISISDVQLTDEGEYTCSIFTMPIRSAKAIVTVLGVPGKPVITGSEDAVREGDALTLTCLSSGSKPPATLHWYRDNRDLEGRPEVVESIPPVPTYTITRELTLTLTKDDNKARIFCGVKHPSLEAGDQRGQSEYLLNVLFPPTVSIHPESDLPREGEPFYLQCVSLGNPEPAAFVWRRVDGELPPLAKVDGAFLHFDSLNKTDNGVYECQANNGIGMGDTTHTLLVQDRREPDLSVSVSPPLPTSPLSPTSVSDPSLSLSAEGRTLPPPSSSSLPFTFPLPPPDSPTTSLSNALFPDLSLPPSITPLRIPVVSPVPLPSTPSSVPRLNGVRTFTEEDGEEASDPTAMSSSRVDHAVIGGVVAVIVFIMLCLLIVLGRYLIRHKGTYLTHEAKGSDDAPDADTAIINAEGGHSGADDKKEYFI